MEPKLIERINELTRLSKERELTDEEKTEREALRTEYRHHFREGMRKTLENTKVEYPDGTRKTLIEHNRENKPDK